MGDRSFDLIDYDIIDDVIVVYQYSEEYNLARFSINMLEDGKDFSDYFLYDVDRGHAIITLENVSKEVRNKERLSEVMGGSLIMNRGYIGRVAS